MMQHFLASRYSPLIPLRLSPIYFLDPFLHLMGVDIGLRPIAWKKDKTRLQSLVPTAAAASE